MKNKIRIKRSDGVLKIIVIVFTAITIGNTIEYFFVTKRNLKHVRGKVENVELGSYLCGGSKFFQRYCEGTTINVEGIAGSFTIRDKRGRGAYITGINEGDILDIYIRKWYQYILTFGTYRSIYILEKNGEVYYDFEITKSSNKTLIMICGIIAIFFGGLYIFQRKTINKMMKGKAV